MQYSLDHEESIKGHGIRFSVATSLARNIHAFELLVGPYAVAHLRITQKILSEGGTLPDDGVHVYLTDTLESPHAKPLQYPLHYKQLGEEHNRAQKVKSTTRVFVGIGNPPYDRQERKEEEKETVKLKGGWVRFRDGDEKSGTIGILKDFIDPLTEIGQGGQAKNLYNDYVYFWRWSLWKIFESVESSGVISFITASSYLRGPGFAGMRKVMRETFDELWIVDLEGDNLGARKTENIFAIQTPVAIAIGVRYHQPQTSTPALVHYTKMIGTERDKLSKMEQVKRFSDLVWRTCLDGWYDPFLPTSDNPYWGWPLITDLFPWQENGVKAGRTWVISPDKANLQNRWEKLLSTSDRRVLFKDSPTGRKVHMTAHKLPPDNKEQMGPIISLPKDADCPKIIPYAFRSFDKEFLLADSRLIDRPSPNLWSAHSNKQVYLTSLITSVLGEGPAAIATGLIPDLHHFSGRGAKDVIPLWRDRNATQANVTKGVLDLLFQTYQQDVSIEDFFAYCYAILATPQYVPKFWDELTIPGIRIPITKDKDLFEKAVLAGRTIVWIHTFGERFAPSNKKLGKIPVGHVQCEVGVPSTTADYPETYAYSPDDQKLFIGKGVFSHIRPKVWDFSVSGLQVVKSWLDYRMKNGAGKKTSPLDYIRPEKWNFDNELLELLWVLDSTIDMQPKLESILNAVIEGEVFLETDLPKPKDAERRADTAGILPMFEEFETKEDADDD